MVRFLTLVILSILMWGCAAAPVKSTQRYFWPNFPDVPRIEWKGIYQSQAQLAEKGFLADVLGEENEMALGFPVFAAGDGMGRIFVADHKLYGIMIFDVAKKATRMLGVVEGKESVRFMRPTGIAFDADGNIYVSDTETKKVYVFDNQEKVTKVLEYAKDAKSIGFLAIDKARKHIVFPDIQGHKIIISDLNGNVISKIGDRGDKDAEFNFPPAVAVDGQGNIIVCDQMNARVQILTPEGKFKAKFGKRGDGVGEFNIIKGVAVDSEGHIYVTDGRSHRFSIFSDAGDILLAVGAPLTEAGGTTVSAGGFNFPNGIFIDQNDTIYVADVFNRRVQLFQYLNEKYLRENPLPAPPKGREPKPQ